MRAAGGSHAPVVDFGHCKAAKAETQAQNCGKVMRTTRMNARGLDVREMRTTNLSGVNRRNLAACAVVIAMVMIFAAAVCAQSSGEKGAPRTGTHAASGEMPLVDLAGYQKVIAKYRGKPLLVTFWATWCEPCETEYPILVELAAKYAPQGLATIGVNMDDDSDLNVAHHFLAKNKPGFPNYRQKPGIDLDAFYRGVNPDWTGSMPETIFYNRDGTIAGHFIGLQPRDTYEQAIHTILASPALTTRNLSSRANTNGR
jgi:thiol-disulfide isomerase/thioredoxin